MPCTDDDMGNLCGEDPAIACITKVCTFVGSVARATARIVREGVALVETLILCQGQFMCPRFHDRDYVTRANALICD